MTRRHSNLRFTPVHPWVTLVGLVGVACLGGQSGGETGTHAPPDLPLPCACIPEGEHPVRARITRLTSGCAELEVLGQLVTPEPDEYRPLEVGNVFGGVLQLRCGGSDPVSEGDEVVALFRRGTQTSATCPEYRTCSAERCGDPRAAYTTVVDPDCAAAQAENPSLDCPPIEVVDEAAIRAYDECDAECLEETRETCLSHASDEQLGGVVLVSKWENHRVWFNWAGEQRNEPWATLHSSECPAYMRDLWQNYYRARPKTPASSQDVAAPPAVVDDDSAVCPAP
jgi:hypothetical protein